MNYLVQLWACSVVINISMWALVICIFWVICSDKSSHKVLACGLVAAFTMLFAMYNLP